MKVRVEYISKITGYKKRATNPSDFFSLDSIEFEIPEISGIEKVFKKNNIPYSFHHNKTTGDFYKNYVKTDDGVHNDLYFTENGTILSGVFDRILYYSMGKRDVFVSKHENNHLLTENFDANVLREIEFDDGEKNKQKIKDMLEGLVYDKDNNIILIKSGEPFFDKLFQFRDKLKDDSFSVKEIMNGAFEPFYAGNPGLLSQYINQFCIEDIDIFSDNNQKSRLFVNMKQIYEKIGRNSLVNVSDGDLIKFIDLRKTFEKINADFENIESSEIVDLINNLLDFGKINKEDFWNRNKYFIQEHSENMKNLQFFV